MQDNARKNQILSWLRLRLRVFAGKLYNLAGVPGIIRECDYGASVSDTRIKVRVGEMFTVVSVNSLDIYFHRLTGSIDGIGLNGAPSSLSALVLESGQLPSPSSLPHRNAQK